MRKIMRAGREEKERKQAGLDYWVPVPPNQAAFLGILYFYFWLQWISMSNKGAPKCSDLLKMLDFFGAFN